ncbi:MAG: hypothetical protein ACJAZ2_001919 [Glaciecola sp.]|jgi:hypothetical protein
MKKLLLFVFAIQTISIAFAQTTILKEHLKFETGAKWNNKVIAGSQYVNSTSGTNQLWDFSAAPATTTEETVVVTADNSTVLITSSLKGDFDYKVSDTTYTYASFSGVQADDPKLVSIGLPHFYGKVWTGTASGLSGGLTVTLNAEVVASGQITTALGTHECLLVKEIISAITGTQTRYFWETVEYGRIASWFYGSDDLLVTESFGVDSTSSISYGSGWEITKSDLYWGLGKELVGMHFTKDITELDVSKGDNKIWDFLAYNNGKLDTVGVFYDNDTLIKVKSNSYPDQYFHHGDSSYFLVKIEEVFLDDPNKTTIGLPHRYGKNWSVTNTVFGYSQLKLQGEVVARGTIKLGLGTFDCLLVREAYTGPISAVHYFWETKEHGRIAAYLGGGYDDFVVYQARFLTPEYVDPSNLGVDAQELNWTDGMVRSNLEYTIDSMSNVLNLATGSGLTWDFTSLTGGISNKTTATINDQKNLDLTSSDGTKKEFYIEDDNYYYESFAGYKLDTPNTTTLALPYVMGKEWHTFGKASKNTVDYDFRLSGTVVGEGTVSTILGNSECVLVKEVIVGDINTENYYWYTEDYGLIASYVNDDGKLVVLQDINANGVSSQSRKKTVALSPNPTKNETVLVESDVVPSKIDILDSQGKLLKTLTNTRTIESSNLTSGTYFVKVHADGKVSTVKLVVE